MSRDFKEISNILQKSVREGKNVYRLLELVSMLPWSKILKLNSKEFLHLLDTGLQSTLKVHKNKSCFDIVLNTVLIVSFN